MANLTLYTIVRRICHTRTAPITVRRQSVVGSQAALAPLSPTRPGKNLHVCVLSLVGSASGHQAFTNPQVDDLQDFKLLPFAELKRKHASFFRGRQIQKRMQPTLMGANFSSKHLPGPRSSYLSGRRITDSHGLPHDAPLGSLTWTPLACHAPSPRRANCPQRQRYARQAPIALRVSTPQGARDFPLTCALIAHDPLRIRALVARDVPYTARRTPGTFGLHTAVRQSPTVCHTPRLLARAVSHAVACDAT